MKPPQLKIVGKTYAVLFLDEVDAEDNNGEHDLQKQEIRVKNAIHFEAKRDVLLHEVLHAVDEQLDLRLKHKQIHALAVGLLQVLRENPHFVQFLTASIPTKRGK